MDCRLWSWAGRTFAIAAVCACALDMSQAYSAEQKTSDVALETAVVRNAVAENVKNLNKRASESEATSKDLTDVDSEDMQVAPSPKKSSAIASKEQKRRSVSKRVRKLNVPDTLGATKSTRKSEKELDQIFASRTKLAPAYIQYAPSPAVSAPDSCALGAFKSEETTSAPKSLVVDAPYVELPGGVRQVGLLNPDSVEPTAPERYPLFEEDALTQESAPLTDDEPGFPAPEPALQKIESLESAKQDKTSTPSAPVYSPFVEAPKAQGTGTDRSSATSEIANLDSTNPFGVSLTNNSRSVVNPSTSFENRFARFTGIFADVELLGWQTDSVKQNYAVSSSENDRVYNELALTPSGTGYRGRIGLRTIYGWDLTCAYTTFDADKAGNVKSGADKLYTSSGKAVDEISAGSDVDLNIYDVEAGRWITREKWAVRPFAGFRWSRLTQTQDVDSWNNAVSSKASNVPTFDDDVATVKEDLESVFARSRADLYGVRLGAEGTLALFRNLSAYGKAAATLGAGDVEYRTVSSSAQGETVRRGKKSCATPAFETAIGLTWRKFGWEVKGGYEFNAWSNASALNGKSSDFATRGFFAGVAWNN